MEFDLSHPVFSTVASVAKDLNVKVFVVGGYVRDQILKRENKDIDFVVIGNGERVATEVAQRLNPELHVTVYKNFGTAMFVFDDLTIEFVGARKESYSRESRNPKVDQGTLADDQNRRDFTINAMAISLNAEDFGTLLDPFTGLNDIEQKIIRTPLNPDITFSDDPLRMLRAVRFATQLNFTIETQTFEALSRNKERLAILSNERIAEELNKIILSPKPSIGFKLLSKSGLLQHIIPELEGLKGVDVKNERKHKDNFFHSLQVLDNISQATNNLWLRWAALLHDIGKLKTKRFDEKTGWTFHGHEVVGVDMVEKIFKRLKLPTNQKLKYVQKLVQLHMRPIILAEETVTDSAVRRLLFEAGDDIDDLMILCDADITSKNSEKVARFLENYRLVRRKLREIEEKDRLRNFQPPITGEMIMQRFGLPPCKTVGEIKEAIKEAILDGKIENSMEAAWEYALKVAEDKGIKPVT